MNERDRVRLLDMLEEARRLRTAFARLTAA